MMRKILPVALFTASWAVSCHPSPKPLDPKRVADAHAFTAKLETDLRRLWVAQQETDWTNETDITDEHEAASTAASGAAANYLTQAIKESRQFDDILDRLDYDTRRQIKLLRLSGTPAPEDPAHAEELAKIGTDMISAYGKGKACDAAGKCKDLGELEDVMAKSRDPNELLQAWSGWHAVGKGIRPMYTRFVELSNEGARAGGYADTSEIWRSRYEMTPAEFEAEVDRLWNQVKPLYDQLHCYTRRKLVEKYGSTVVPAGGAIPAHLLGNMWAQTWNNVYDLLEPYPGRSGVDVTEALTKAGYDPIKMVKTAEGFFVSLGLDPLPSSFWQRSMFVKPPDKEVVCHASAWDVQYDDDLRIKMCIKINQEDLVTIHHELGHDYYFHAYHTLPMLYQDGANDGFHEAIGDAIALSTTPDYWAKLALIPPPPKDEEAAINELMKRALDKVAFLPFGALVDRWRWEVFSGRVTPDRYNARWWELREQYQGVAPPIPRTEEDFDPGAKYHIPANTPYMRYFLATILQFQFHRALCRHAGFKGPLHECSVYGSKEAGAALEKMLALGASKPWPDALEALTGERKMDASAILEYFAPLQKWLEEQNKGQKCGW